MNLTADKIKYLKALSQVYPNINRANSEIINLQAVLNLPKGTEHFVSDIHGEYEAFSHVIRNASGVIKTYINAIFGNSLMESDKKALATLIYYPEQKLKKVNNSQDSIDEWYKITLYRLILICKTASSKYTRSKVRKALPKDFEYIIEELLHEDETEKNKEKYYNGIIQTIIELYQADRFIIALSYLIQRLAIDRLHIIGDIFDRGAKAAKIMDMLVDYHNVDIQWGNHDISIMGAAAGCKSLICNVVRLHSKYGILETIEDDYGINLIPLATFAMETYEDDPCNNFMPEKSRHFNSSKKEIELTAKMHKAISIIQFKLEGQIIKRRPEYDMEDRLLLDKINHTDKTITIGETIYKLSDTVFPTIDPTNPYELSAEEKVVLEKISFSFRNSQKLRQHVKLLFTNGSIYTICNSNLLFHGGIPVNDDGSIKTVTFKGNKLKGREFLDAIERSVREGFFSTIDDDARQECLDYYWYLWCGENSPLFGKLKMTTFERYFIDDKTAYYEEESNYYKLRDNENMCINVLRDFDLNPETSHIINGHVPVKVSKGESPIKANGKLFVIDGGFTKAYQPVTGIAGYTLIYNSHGMMLVSHEPFESTEKAVEDEIDIFPFAVAREYSVDRIYIHDTDIGKEISEKISDLRELLYAYNKGIIKPLV